MLLANNFALSDAEDNTSGPLNGGDITDLSLLRTLLAIRQKFHDRSFCFNSICKFGRITRITSLSELYFRFRRFNLLKQMKKEISMNYGSRTSS